MQISKLKYLTRALMALIIMPSFALCANGAQNKQTTNNSTINEQFEAEIDISITAKPSEIPLFDGEKTAVYKYEAELLKGEPSSLQEIPNSYLGPIIRVKPQQKIRVRFHNELPDESIIHWHGLHVPHEMDGHPVNVVKTGEQFVYEFVVDNKPGTYWFHPHPHGKTGLQVYKGLAGLFIVEDNRDNMPAVEYEVPLVIQDRRFDSSNQLVYLENNRMDRMVGFLGDEIIINGQSKTLMELKKGTYRFRVLNGSNSRIYKLAWSDGADMTIIGNDGGLLSKPTDKPYIMLSPGERVEVWRDFSLDETDSQISLNSLSFDNATMMGMMGGGRRGGMMSGRGMMRSESGVSETYIDNGEPLTLFNFIVKSQQGEVVSLPTELEAIETFDLAEAVNEATPRQFDFHFQRMQWFINGKVFEMTEVADWEKVKLNTTEVWEFINSGSGRDGRGMGNMMQMPHPVHIHGLQFQIIERNVSQVPPLVWNSMKDGFVDDGWQDTFLLLPGMRVKVALRFEDFTGLFIYHCHNLEHEDMGMMRNYEVVE